MIAKRNKESVMPTFTSRIPSAPSSRTSLTPSSLPTSRIPRSPSPGKACPSTGTVSIPTKSKLPRSPSATPSPSARPKHPEQILEARKPVIQTTPPLSECPSSNSDDSHYITAHLGEPCTTGALDHLLSCGHKVTTDRPEDCASNCSQHSMSADQRVLDEDFICMACTTTRIRKDHANKARVFEQDLKRVAKVAGKRLSTR